MCWGVQFIDPTGEKKFLKGTKKLGYFYQIGILAESTKIVGICEGFDTGVSLHNATGLRILSAFNFGNLVNVANGLKEKFPNIEIFIFGDDEKANLQNPGRLQADFAAKALNGLAIFPKFEPIDLKGTDFNDMASSQGTDSVRSHIEEAVARYESRFETAEKNLLAFIGTIKSGESVPDFSSELVDDLMILEKEKPSTAAIIGRRLSHKGLS
ncbi:MAG: toprim domain-containing protein [Proteobacteria bacterium]|nr:toprim domain-containing protein [Pseudomonadota bacterium]